MNVQDVVSCNISYFYFTKNKSVEKLALKQILKWSTPFRISENIDDSFTIQMPFHNYGKYKNRKVTQSLVLL